MAHEVKSNLWLEKFSREALLRSSVILCGNVNDIIESSERSGQYIPVKEVVINRLRELGYDRIIKWDRADGIDSAYDSFESSSSTPAPQTELYDIGIPIADTPAPVRQLAEPDEFFPALLRDMARENDTRKTAYIIDYSDYIFGSPNSTSEKERNYLTELAKSLNAACKYDVSSQNFWGVSKFVLMIARDKSAINPSYYLKNPLVGEVVAPLPGRRERSAFVEAFGAYLNVSAGTNPIIAKNDFIDSLEGFSLKEIAQIIKLSRLPGNENLSYERLVNLYKYGEKVSPWEELSKEKLSEIKERLSARVKGQQDAVNKAANVVLRAYTWFSVLHHSAKKKNPKGVLFFVGPTGVGKTELAKALAEFIFGDENACIRFDMSEFNHEHSDQRLVGAPPGYVGYEAGGQLTNAVKEKPFSVLLFDEIEKADKKILDKFLQILEDGRLTDGKGETVSFSETIIIFTSNIGASEADINDTDEANRKYFIGKVREHFIQVLQRPELLNRIGDNIVAFNFIKDDSVLVDIARLKFQPVIAFMKERYGVTLQFSDESAAFSAIAKSADKANGGRGISNIIESSVVNMLSDFVFRNMEMLYGRTIRLTQRVKELARFKPELV